MMKILYTKKRKNLLLPEYHGVRNKKSREVIYDFIAVPGKLYISDYGRLLWKHRTYKWHYRIIHPFTNYNRTKPFYLLPMRGKTQWRDGSMWQVSPARLVADHFMNWPDCKDPVIIPKDGSYRNCKVENLEIIDSSQLNKGQKPFLDSYIPPGTFDVDRHSFSR